MEPAALHARLPWRIPIALAITYFFHYLDRNIIAVALPAMAVDFGWSDREIGRYGEWLLGAFVLTYGLSQILLASWAERWGTRRSLLLVVVSFSIVTVFFGIAGGLGSMALLIALRAALGVAESVHVPMMSAITSQHFPASVRARANTTWSVGIVVATAVGPVLTVPLIISIGWAKTFILLGLVGIVLMVPLLMWAVPKDGKPLEREEVAWRFTRQRGYWHYVGCNALNAFCVFGILGWLPTYFTRAKGVDFHALGWPLAIVFTTGVVGTFVLAALGDRAGRRLGIAAAGLFLASPLIAAAVAVDSVPVMVALFALAVLAQSGFAAQQYATMQQLVQDRRVGAATGLCNGLALVVGGVGGSLVPGAVVSATGSFDRGLLSIAVGALLAGIATAALSWRTKL
jgi:MFS family permease